MKKSLIAVAICILALSAPARADNVGAVFGAAVGSVAFPVGTIVGAIVGGIWGKPFWGPASPTACWIDDRWHRHCPNMLNAVGR